MKLTPEQQKQIDRFLEFRFPKIELTDDDRERYKRAWAIGGRGWNFLAQGGVGQSRVIIWYQNVRKPNSKEWRPSIMVRELLYYLDFVEQKQ